jgi:hypothetical protein
VFGKVDDLIIEVAIRRDRDFIFGEDTYDISMLIYFRASYWK